MGSVDLKQCIAKRRERFFAKPTSRAFVPLADVLCEVGEHEEALGLLEDGLVAHPDCQAAMVVLARTLLAAGRSDHADKILTRVLELDADNTVVLKLLAREAQAGGDDNSARKYLAKLKVLEPDTPVWDEALSQLQEADGPAPIQTSEAPFVATMTLVDIYLAQGYRGKAMSALLQMQAREPSRLDVIARIEELRKLALPKESVGMPGDSSGDYELRQSEDLATRRREEKQSFERWLLRIRADETASS